MRVLLTNNTLVWHAGSEMYIRDLAVALFRRGHQPIAYSRDLGPVADELRAASVPVVDDLGRLTVRPDVIHAQHHVETITALLRWPDVPAVYVCHGWEPWEEVPVWHPRIRRFIAVSDLLAERLVSSGIPSERVEVIGNAVDLARFRPRRRLPKIPTRAVVFNNRASEDVYLPLVRAVCAESGLSMDVIGSAAGTSTAQPENHLADYDLVFASGRSALEALAVGCAVVLCDETALGGMVTTKDLDRMRAFNFGLRVLQNPLTGDNLKAEIQRYDAADALEVSERIRGTADLGALVDGLEALYRDAIEEQTSAPPDREDEARAEVAYMQWLKHVITDREDVAGQKLELARERDRLRSALEKTNTDRIAQAARSDELVQRWEGQTLELEALEARYRAVVAERDTLHSRLSAMEQTATWRARDRFLSLPAVVRGPARVALRIARLASGSKPATEAG